VNNTSELLTSYAEYNNNEAQDTHLTVCICGPFEVKQNGPYNTEDKTK